MTDTTARRRIPRRRTRRPRDPEGRMALGDHLRELRSRVVKSALAVVLAGVVGWIWYEPIIDLLAHPLDVARSTRGGTGLVTLNFAGIADPFTLKLKISFFVGLLIASPVWIYQLWAFITPGLHRNERRYALGFLGAAVPFFLLGAWLAFTVMPKAIEFLISLTPTDGSNVVDASFYFTFVTRFILAFGLAFLLPVAMVGVNMVGLVSARRMLRAWRITVLAIFVFAAAATPTPDAGTMLLLGGSIVFLYALALGVCFLHDRRKARRAGEAESASWSDDEASPIEPVVRDPADDRPSPLD
jgi:sec-independent protein translocase protein TatC